jgi:2-polyprenyl-3-methyl-5-hydroxy-6-metoxy-1,4-benzoquinol methylase
MSTDRWVELYRQSSVLSGNVAKMKVLEKLRAAMAETSPLAVLDVGCVGLRPLEFWEPLLGDDRAQFRLTGVDVKDVAPAREIVERRGWQERVTLRQGSGYNLTRLFPAESFDRVTATQVLEHVARLALFMEQIATVLKPGGEVFFTVDSAHWRSRFDSRDSVRLVKNVIKKSLSLVKYERHYDLPWRDHEVAAACRGAGLEVVECRYYNLAPLKFIHNHIIPAARKNAFMRLWLELEEFLNEDEAVKSRAKEYFLGFYLHVRKPATAGTTRELRAAV